MNATILGSAIIAAAIISLVAVVKLCHDRHKKGTDIPAIVRASVALTAVVSLLAGVVLIVSDDVSRPADASTVRTDESSSTTPTSVVAGNQDNTDPVFKTMKNWRELVTIVENENANWYKQCMVDHLDVTWEEAQLYAELEAQGHNLNRIEVLNSSLTDEEARQILRDQGFDVEGWPIERMEGNFQNTKGIPGQHCEPFSDNERAQVRVALSIPLDPDDPDKGFVENEGVLGMCGNMFGKLPPELVNVTTTTTPTGQTVTTITVTTTEQTTTTVTVCDDDKGCTGATVTTRNAPPTTIGTPQTTVTTTGSGPGAVSTIPTPPTTNPPHPTTSTSEAPVVTVEY